MILFLKKVSLTGLPETGDLPELQVVSGPGGVLSKSCFFIQTKFLFLHNLWLPMPHFCGLIPQFVVANATFLWFNPTICGCQCHIFVV
jgi:hypothetical protein